MAALGAACAVLWFLARAIQALPLLEFGDETDHVVGARMIAAGETLYSSIFVNHGPLAYALSHLWLLFTGTRDLASYRLVSLALFALCAAAIYASPALRQPRARLHALTLFLVPLGVVYAGTTLHMVMYQSMAGALLTVELALFAVPAVLGVAPPRWAAVAAGFAATWAVFSALSFAVAAALLAVTVLALPPDAAGLRRRAIAGFVLGALAGVLSFGVWMTLYSDWVGYFVYHYWFNLTVFAESIRYSPLSPLRALTRFALRPDTVIRVFAVVFYYAGVIALIALAWRRAGAPAGLRRGLGLAALAVGVAFFNPRGALGFHGSTFLAGVLGLGALVAANLFAADPGAGRARTIAVNLFATAMAVCLVLVYLFGQSSPHRIPLKELSRHGGAARPSEARAYQVVRELVREDERILAIVFAPAVYLLADRLPVSGNIFYLPMQAEYARRPFPGYHIDLCKDVLEKRPKVVFWRDQRDADHAWGFAKYAPCVHREIVANYVQLPWAPEFFVRRDLAAARPDIMSGRCAGTACAGEGR